MTFQRVSSSARAQVHDRLVRGASVLAALALSIPSASPASAEKIRPGDIRFIGSFELPSGEIEGTRFQYNRRAGMTWDKARDVLWVTGRSREGLVGGFRVPASLGTSSPLPVAEMAFPPQDWSIKCCDIKTAQKTGGIELVYDQRGETRHWGSYDWYAVTPGRYNSVGWSDSDGKRHGPFRVAGNADSRQTAKFSANVPQKFAERHLGGRNLVTGNEKGLLGGGPVLWAIDPRNPKDAVQLTHWEKSYEKPNKRTLTYPEPPWRADEYRGIAWVDDTLLIAAERASMQWYGICGKTNKHGQPHPSPELCCGPKGWHGEPFRPIFYFVDTKQLAEVASGKRKPHDVDAYASSEIPGPLFTAPGCARYNFSELEFDPETRRLFLHETAGELGISTIHVYSVEVPGPSEDESEEPESPAPLKPPGDVLLTPASKTRLEVQWSSDSMGEVELDLRSPTSDWQRVAAVRDSNRWTLVGLQPSTPYTLRARVIRDGRVSEWSHEASASTVGEGGPCLDDGTAVCLLGGRFELRSRWRDQRRGEYGTARAIEVPDTEKTGLFWFFSDSNIELIVKMLDGRPVNDAYWHFYGALSETEFWITVRDVLSNETRTYHNPPFEQCGAADTSAFPGTEDRSESTPHRAAFDVLGTELTSAARADPGLAHSSQPSTSSGACEPSDQQLCLGDDRFAVRVDWVDQRKPGQSGPAHVSRSVGTDDAGFFWFSSPENLELAVKVIDGRAVNGHFWLFWGGLTDLEYTMTVRDTVGGRQKVVHNEPFDLCGGSDVEAL